jgi:hypothetical protein
MAGWLPCNENERVVASALLARVTGLEPATSGVTGRRSNQLSYTRSGRPQRLGWAERGVKGVSAASAKALMAATTRGLARQHVPQPRHATQKDGLVGGDGIEPPTLSV